MEKALGLIETVGKATAIEALDAAVKSAEVALAGLENSRGGGRMTVKLEGEVAAVEAAVEAALRAAERMGGEVYAHRIIARPSCQVRKMLSETAGKRDESGWRVRKSAEVEGAPGYGPQTEREATCNLCGDPRCTRVRGEARAKCIHYHQSINK